MTVIANVFSGPKETLIIKPFLDDLVQNPRSSADIWAQLRAMVAKIVFATLFPKLDLGVTKGLNHLIRCPMSIHQETDNISIALCLDRVDSMDPALFPCLRRKQTLRTLTDVQTEFAARLQCRQPFANFLVCMHCAEPIQNLYKLPKDILFGTDKIFWTIHREDSHPQSPYVPDTSTLRVLVNQRSRKPDGTEDWEQKMACYDQLNRKLKLQ
jgi:hypothetical protein